jgi:hypothetical protein
MGERDRRAVDDDEVDLGVRDAERLDGVLHRRRLGESVRDVRLATIGGEEVVQLAVAAERGVPARR